jgi:predicted nucleotidyltransferase
VLSDLFREEEQRFDAIVGKVREAAEDCRPSLVAAWVYGSVARREDRPSSDLDIAAVATPDNAPAVEYRLREALLAAENELVFRSSVVALDTDDVMQLATQNDPLWVALRNDAMAILGESPEILLQRLSRANPP